MQMQVLHIGRWNHIYGWYVLAVVFDGDDDGVEAMCALSPQA